MIKPFDPELDPKLVTLDKVEHYTGLNLGNLISLSGIFGIPSIVYNELKPKIEIEYPEITVMLNYQGRLRKKHLTINLVFCINLEEMIIDNNFCFSSLRKEGIGLSIVKSQVYYATKMGFNELKGTAFGNFEKRLKYNGYITWGKLGYVMYEKISLDMFSKKLEEARKEFKLNEKAIPKFLLSSTLFDLLSTKDGEQFWLEKGESWQAKFYLKLASVSRTILETYENKKIKIK